MLTSGQFERARHLALRLAGIELVDRHREILYRRSLRLGILEGNGPESDGPERNGREGGPEGNGPEGNGLDALLRSAEDGDPEASQRLISLITTNQTEFFREPAHFDVAAEHALQLAKRRGQARCWSAAAATGEEPYSLAMALTEVFRREETVTSLATDEGPGVKGLATDEAPSVKDLPTDEELRVTILATDIDLEALAVARRGEYSVRALAGLNADRLERFFTETTADQTASFRQPAHFDVAAEHALQAGQPRSQARWRIKSAVRRLVEFEALNLVDVAWQNIEGPFDVIFCRNVLMYLEASYRYSVLERLASLLAPDGLLILDPTEHLGKAGHFFGPADRTCWQLAGHRGHKADGVYSRRRTSLQGRWGSFQSATCESGMRHR